MKFSQKHIISALKASRGIQTIAAESLGISRVTLSKGIANNPVLSNKIQEYLLDFAESKLLEAIERKEPWAIKMYLHAKLV